jgi:hypothetical protein
MRAMSVSRTIAASPACLSRKQILFCEASQLRSATPTQVNRLCQLSIASCTAKDTLKAGGKGRNTDWSAGGYKLVVVPNPLGLGA